MGTCKAQAQRESTDRRRFVGLLLEDKGVLRNHMKVVVDGIGEGEITSGGFSPTIERSIALARVPSGAGADCTVEIRGREFEARLVKPPFVWQGQAVHAGVLAEGMDL